MTLYEKALYIAEIAHSGQTRKGSITPYVEHPKKVAELVMAYANGEVEDIGLSPEDFPVIELYGAVALLHDVLEDAPEWTEERLRNELLAVAPVRYVDVAMAAIILLTKRRGEPYFPYLTRIIDNEIARLVKIFDVTHNLSDLQPGNLRDKYELALYYLKN